MTAIRKEQLEALGPRACAACQPARVAAPSTAPANPAPRATGPPVIVVSRDTPAWLAIELRDEAGVPVAGEPFSVVLPDGKHVTGALDGRGAVRLEGVSPGACKVSFVERDAEGWRAVVGGGAPGAKAGAP